VVSEGGGALSLEEARARLRRLGYLDGRVERFLFRRAFEGRGGLFLPAILIGAFSAAFASLASVEAAEAGFRGSPAAAGSLLLHLFLADLTAAALLGLLLGFLADRSRAPGGTGTALGLAAAGVVFFLWIAGTYGLAREWSLLSLLWGVPVALCALLLASSVRSGYLARAYARSHVLPRRPRRRTFLAASAVALLATAALFALPREKRQVPSLQPSPRREALVVAAVDGLALDSRAGDAAAKVGALLRRGATGWWPAKTASPPEIWTDIATGVAASDHGVRALARVRPAGSSLALRPPLGTAWYLRGAGPALGLVRSAPVSASDRESLAFWEIAAAAGLPSLAVGWWASGDWPGAVVLDNRTLLSSVSGGIEADRKALAAFEPSRGQAVSTVYLPGADILRSDPARRAAALSGIEQFLEREIERATRRETVLAVLAVDSHPGAGALGRMVVFDGAPFVSVRIRAMDVAPSLLARAGLPIARDLPGRPAPALFRENTLEKTMVATYGERVAPQRGESRASDREYLEKLKSLGYLN